MKSYLLIFLSLIFSLKIGISAYSVLQPKLLLVGANSASNPTSVALIVSNNRVGISITNPSVLLSVVTTGSELTGTAMSSTFRTNTGPLGTTAGSELALGSIGFTSSNQISLGIRATRVNLYNGGIDWYSTAIGLGIDIDNSVRKGGYLYLTSQNVGIGTSVPQYKLHVNGSMKSTKWNTTEVMQNATGPGTGAVSTSITGTTTFTSNGGTLMIYASGSGYRTSGTRLIVYVYITNTSDTNLYYLGDLKVYTNTLSSHRTLIPRTFVTTSVPAGTYKIKFTSDSSTFLNSLDFFNCTVTEWPF